MFDGDEFVARTHQVALPEDVNASAINRITWLTDGTIYPSRSRGHAKHHLRWQITRIAANIKRTTNTLPCGKDHRPASIPVRLTIGKSDLPLKAFCENALGKRGNPRSVEHAEDQDANHERMQLFWLAIEQDNEKHFEPVPDLGKGFLYTCRIRAARMRFLAPRMVR